MGNFLYPCVPNFSIGYLCVPLAANLTYFRCMGYFIRFIHNRDLAAESIMKAYIRTRIVLASPAGYIEKFLRRVKASGVSLPKNSMLKLANEVQSSFMSTNVSKCTFLYPLVLILIYVVFNFRCTRSQGQAPILS